MMSVARMRPLPVLAALILMSPVLVASPATAAGSAPPKVSSVSASSGPLVGGERISVHGSGFTHVVKVFLGGAQTHSVRVTSSRVLTVVVPQHKAGRVDLRVVTTSGESTVVKADRFTYVAPPTVTSVKSASGPVAGGARVTIKGKNLLHVKAVLFGKTKGAKLHVTSATSLSVTSPAHVTGQVDVRVTTAYGTSKAGRADRYGYLTPAGPIAPIPPAPTPPAPPAPRNPPVIGAVVLPAAPQGNNYAGVTLTATAGTPPYHWTAKDLPGGLQISTAGALSGTTYAVAGSKRVTVSVTDSKGATATAILPLTVTPYGGVVHAWGYNAFSNVGDGTTTTRTAPVQVNGLNGTIAISGDLGNGFAVKSNGTVFGWGDNSAGFVGDGTTTARATPVQVPGLAGITTVVTGGDTAYALSSVGTVFAWGSGSDGTIGDGRGVSEATPTQVPDLTDAVAIAGGRDSAYALRADGTVVAWGDNAYGQLGDGTTTRRLSPVVVPGLTGIMAIAAGDNDAWALHRDGTVSGWGENDTLAVVGAGATANQATPVTVPGLSDITQLAGRENNGYAVRGDGTIWAWGNNGFGQVGDGSLTTATTPVEVSGVTNAASVSATSKNVFAVLDDGTVDAWGAGDAASSSGTGDGTAIVHLTPVTATWLSSTIGLGDGIYTAYVVERGVAKLPPMTCTGGTC
jgi:alpha-tubulin suppressor-like RCC1 family protein